MKKICLYFFIPSIFLVTLLGFAFLKIQPVFADPAIPVINVTPAPDNTMVPDADVNFAGKTAARAADFVDWNLQHYQWASTNYSYLTSYWVKIRNIIYALLLVFILSAAFIIIISHGTNFTVWKFITRFIIIVILITFSFALLQLLYQLTDVFQGFFVHNPAGAPLSKSDLLLANVDYSKFSGMRKAGIAYDESAFITINLVKITAITYYVMGGILLIRKIILWFFIIISPIFPLLILYIPLRNTAKIWIGELFRWLLYGPLFFLLLSGLVVLWQKQINILPFSFISNPANLKTIVYPNATNIFLAGPGIDPKVNSINNNETFIQYIVALIMLWAVILLPFLLLRIFLDYVITLSIENEQFDSLKGKLNWVNNIMHGNLAQTNVTKKTSEENSSSSNLTRKISSFIREPNLMFNNRFRNDSSVASGSQAAAEDRNNRSSIKPIGITSNNIARDDQTKGSGNQLRKDRTETFSSANPPQTIINKVPQMHLGDGSETRVSVKKDTYPEHSEHEKDQSPYVDLINKIRTSKSTSTSIGNIKEIKTHDEDVKGIARDQSPTDTQSGSNNPQDPPTVVAVRSESSDSKPAEQSGLHENAGDILADLGNK